MATSPSLLQASHQILVLDASVLINLLGSGRPGEILAHLGRRFVVEQIALAEVRRDPSSGLPANQTLDPLFSAGLLHTERMSGLAYRFFLQLTGAPSPDDLGDGEAATIAHAADLGAVAVLDERKAIRVAKLKFPDVILLNTLDLLSNSLLAAKLGPSEVGNIVRAALSNARMRVPRDYRQWVDDVTG